MSVTDALVHAFFKAIVHTVLLPLRNQAFETTRRAKISKTEKEALASGSVGFEGEFLKGAPDWHKLMDMPPPQLTDEELAFLNGPVEGLCALLDDWKIRSELKDLPPEAWDYLKQHRFFGMIIPKQYGGLGFSAQAHSAVILKIASRSTTACVTAMVPNSLGPAELLMHYGTDAQKEYYLPRLACGEEIPSFALTEPNAGSDASSMQSTGVICEQNGELGIRLNWDKRYITLAPISTLLGIAFKLYDPDGLLGLEKDLGITLALVPVNTPGVTVGQRHNPLGIPFQNGPTTGKNVFIPLNMIIGDRAYAGQGWRMLMECLAVGRCVSLPAMSVGASKLMCRAAGAYSRVRKQFRTPIGKFEGVEELLARMAGLTYMMEGARYTTLQMLDKGEQPTILSAVLKYHMTECGRKIVNDGMDIMGGKAICEGPGNIVGGLYHGMPIGITVEGANILTRNMIIFGQGSVRSHPFILKEMEAARMDDKNEARKQFSDLMAYHVQHSVTNTMRSLVYGLFDGGFSPTPRCSAAEKRYYQHINRLSAAYATIADMALMILGDAVKRKERLSALLGDTMSYLYLASCTLRRYHSEGRPEEDKPLMHWACQQMLYQAEESMDRLLQNFPAPWMGVMLRPVIFPRGRRFHPPSHRLERQVAKILLAPGDSRNRLTDGIYLPQAKGEPMAQMEQALDYTITAEALESRVREAMKAGKLTANTPHDLIREAVDKGILTDQEAGHLQETERACKPVIDVDDFDPFFGQPAPDSQPEPEHLAIADEKTLASVYPQGTRWNIDIPHLNLTQMMDEAILQHADKACIDFLGKRYNYREFGNLINKAAAGLQVIGVTKGTKIGMCMPNTPYYPILFFAALKAGATVVNFCPMLTESELRQQAKDSDTRIMITLDLKELFDKFHHLQESGGLDHIIICRMEDMLPWLKAQAYRFIRGAHIARPGEIEQFAEPTPGGAKPIIFVRELINVPVGIKPVQIDPEDVAVLQYTGGTTGSPKGAMLTHANLVANVAQVEEFFCASPDKPNVESLFRPGYERILVSIPYFHVFAMTVAMILSLKLGSELIILPDPRNIKETLKTIHEKRPTLFPTVPRLLQAICESPKVNQCDLSRLEMIFSGGAALPRGVKDNFEALAKKDGVIKQGYGLTETSPVACSNPPYGTNKPETVGLPMPRTRVKITDPSNPYRTLSIGEVGEICIHGPQVMKGYYNRQQETADVLQDGWLRTGDLGYLDEEYYLHIVDRKKRLILVNGYNVYPTQIEQAISKHPAVAECLVITVQDTRSGEAAKAFIRLKRNLERPPTVLNLLDFLSEHLSRIELPKFIEFVEEELPKTAVGKPDWKVMQERERQKTQPSRDDDTNESFRMEQAS